MNLASEKKRKVALGSGRSYTSKSTTSRRGPTEFSSRSPMAAKRSTIRPFKKEKPRARFNCDVYKPPVGLSKDKCLEKYAKNNLAVVCNPWFETEFPKYPDGKAQWSIGRKFRFAEEIRSTTEGTFLIALFAGVNNWALAIQPGKPKEETYKLLSNHVTEGGIQFDSTYIEAPEGSMEDNTRMTLIPTDKSYESWRPVSVGLRLKCLNTDEEDGGWWEAIRTSRDKVFRDMGFMFRYPNVTSNTHPSKKTYNGNISLTIGNVRKDANEDKADWANIPSYCTGKVTHLQFYDFQLNYIREDNDFIRLGPTELIKGVAEHFVEYPDLIQTDQYVSDTVVVHKTFNEEDHQVWENERPREMLVADCMDVILIRIHGQKETKIFMEGVYNQEVLVPQEGTYSTYQTPTMAKRETLEKIVKARNDNFLLPYQKTRRSGGR